MSRAVLVAHQLAQHAEGRHPITTFVAAAAGMLAAEPDRLEVRETIAGANRDYLLVEILPAWSDFGRIIGQRGVIVEGLRMLARRMAQRDNLTVEVKVRERPKDAPALEGKG